MLCAHSNAVELTSGRLVLWTLSWNVLAGPVLKRNDTEDARARVLDSEELIVFLQKRAQQAVDSRDDTEEHQRHVSIQYPLALWFTYPLLQHAAFEPSHVGFVSMSCTVQFIHGQACFFVSLLNHQPPKAL